MKVPEPRKLKSGNYRVQLRLNGESISITAPSASECRNRARILKAEYLDGRRTPVAKTDQTLNDVLQAYIDRHSAVLSPSTVLGYDKIRRNRFVPYQKTPVSEIDFQEMINRELAIKSAKTVKNAWGFCKTALAYSGIQVPEVKMAQVPVREIPFLQPDEIPPFCEALKGKSYEIPLLLELHGLRLSEVLGLSWKDIDLKRKVIHIHGAVVTGIDGDVRKDTVKNASSNRSVPIMIPRLMDALREVKEKKGPVVTADQQALLRDAYRTCRNAGVTQVGNHGLRHSFASLCYHLGISERQLMSWGGWADYTTMHRVYIRLASADEESAKKSVENYFSFAHENAHADKKSR